MYSGTNYFRSRPGRLAKVFQRFSGSFVVITESEWQMYASSQRLGRPSQLPPSDTSGLRLSNRPLIIWKVTSINSLTYNLICQEERNQVLYSTTFYPDSWTPIEVYYEQLSIIKENKYRFAVASNTGERSEQSEYLYDIDNIWQLLPNAVSPVRWNVPRRWRTRSLIARVAVEADYPRVAVEVDYSHDNV